MVRSRPHTRDAIRLLRKSGKSSVDILGQRPDEVSHGDREKRPIHESIAVKVRQKAVAPRPLNVK